MWRFGSRSDHLLFNELLSHLCVDHLSLVGFLVVENVVLGDWGINCMDWDIH